MPRLQTKASVPGVPVSRDAVFPHRVLPYLLLAPQLALALVFFVAPALNALHQSLYRADPFGLHQRFSGLTNFIEVALQPQFQQALRTTALFAIASTVLAMGIGLLLAGLTESLGRSRVLYRTLFIWPYAVAPAITGSIWLFMFTPQVGIVAQWLQAAGVDWNIALNGRQALLLVVAVSAWQQIAYNFLFFSAGLQAIPASLLEAASLDGASAWVRFRTIVLPLLAPTSFFLLVMNTVFVLFETFGLIGILTRGGPANATQTLVYKLYQDGFLNLDLGAAAAQTVMLMLIVGALTVLQFRHLGRRVHYR